MKNYFDFMGAIWSCSAQTWEALCKLVEAEQPFDLSDYPDVRELRRRPSGKSAPRLIGKGMYAGQQ